MYTILLPVDRNVDRARTQARFVTDLPGVDDWGTVTVANAFAGEDAPDSMRSVDRIESVHETVQHLERHEVDVDAVRVGEPIDDAIVSLADDLDADLVVMGGRKRSPAGKVLFGSVTQSVILDTDRPVAVTGTHTAESDRD